MKNTLSRANTLQQVGEQLQSQYGDNPIPIGIIRREASNIGGFKESSILPSDFCYNCMNMDPVSMTDPMFIKVGAGMYRYLGRNYPYSGPILWKPKGEPERIVGEWINGRRNFTNDPRQNGNVAEPRLIKVTKQAQTAPMSIKPPPIDNAMITGVAATVPRENCVSYDVLWERIEHHLCHGIPNWKQRIEKLNQVSAIKARAQGYRWSDDHVFKGIVLSVLSNSTDWAKIESIQSELDAVFSSFRLRDYSILVSDDITRRLVPWFENRGAGSQFLSRGLLSLIVTAGKLITLAEEHGSLDHYFGKLVAQRNGDLPSVAVDLGGPFSPHKLPGLGIPLAAEFLKNIGYDIAKPDRHINRAAGSFGWVKFGNWAKRDGTRSPTASQVELIAVMREMAMFASALRLHVCYVDNAVWLLCAKSGLYLDNKTLSGFPRLDRD